MVASHWHEGTAGWVMIPRTCKHHSQPCPTSPTIIDLSRTEHLNSVNQNRNRGKSDEPCVVLFAKTKWCKSIKSFRCKKQLLALSNDHLWPWASSVLMSSDGFPRIAPPRTHHQYCPQVSMVYLIDFFEYHRTVAALLEVSTPVAAVLIS